MKVFCRSIYNGLVKQLRNNDIKVDIQPVATISDIAESLDRVRQKSQKLKYLILGGHSSSTKIEFYPFDGSDVEIAFLVRTFPISMGHLTSQEFC